MSAISHAFDFMYIPILIIDVSCALTLISINISLLKSLSKRIKSKQNSFMIVISLLTTVTSLIFVIPTLVLTFMHLAKYTFNVKWRPYTQIAIISTMIYFISQSFTIYLLTLRIDKTFKDSSLRLNDIVIKVLYALATLEMIAGIANPIVLLIIPDYPVMIIIWCTLQSITSIILMILFINRIDKIVLRRVETNLEDHVTKTDKQTESIQEILRNKSNKLITVTVKYGVLVPIAIVSTFIGMMGVAVIVKLFTLRIECVALCIMCMDCTVGSICVYLMFGFNDGIYQSFCMKLHNLCMQRKLNKMQNLIVIRKSDGNTSTAESVNPESVEGVSEKEQVVSETVTV